MRPEMADSVTIDAEMATKDARDSRTSPLPANVGLHFA